MRYTTGMSDQARIKIFAVAAFILLVGAIISARIDSSKPILNQIVQIIRPTATSTTTKIISVDSPALAISAAPNWFNEIQKQSASSTSTSPTWKQAVVDNQAIGVACAVATTTLSIPDISAQNLSVSFAHAVCPESAGIPLSYSITGNTINAYSNSSKQGPARTVARFWILGDKKPEDIMSALIYSLPSAYERGHCLIVQDPNKAPSGIPAYPRYLIEPDDALNTLNSELHPNEIPFLCGEYGLSEVPHFFEQVGGLLLFISTGQDVPPFDPDSFKS
jgi:hypothetical protein